LYAFINKINL